MAIVAQKIARKSVPEVCVYAQNVHDQMSLNAGTFTTPPVLMKDFLAHINDLFKAEAATYTGSYTSFEDRDAKYSVLVMDLNKLGIYVQDKSDGSSSIITSAGMEMRKSPQKLNELGTPVILEVNNNATGKLELKISRVENARNYACEYSLSITDPDWKNGGNSSNTKIMVENLTPKTSVWLRVRALGTNSIVSNWSDAISKLVS